MTLRENVLSILNYGTPDALPVLNFGYWVETTDKWAEQGYITREEAEAYRQYGDNGPGDVSIRKKLGFDWCWGTRTNPCRSLMPAFTPKVLEIRPDGSRLGMDEAGLITVTKPGITSIPSEVGTSLTGRETWEELYLPKLRYSDERLDLSKPPIDPETSEVPVGIFTGSLMGDMRNLLGVEALSYLWADDEDLYREIVDTMCGICYRFVEETLKRGYRFDFGHFWEDICFRNGPLVSPRVFEELCGPWYKKITELLAAHGTRLVSLDCDGCIDALIPTWLKNGVNVMFPIEVGVWNANIAPWREKYGRELRGVGGVNKLVFSRDRAAVDAEIERLKPLIAMGGFIPCVDHRIAPDGKFELVQYYCEKMHELKI